MKQSKVIEQKKDRKPTIQIGHLLYEYKEQYKLIFYMPETNKDYKYDIFLNGEPIDEEVHLSRDIKKVLTKNGYVTIKIPVRGSNKKSKLYGIPVTINTTRKSKDKNVQITVYNENIFQLMKNIDFIKESISKDYGIEPIDMDLIPTIECFDED